MPTINTRGERRKKVMPASAHQCWRLVESRTSTLRSWQIPHQSAVDLLTRGGCDELETTRSLTIAVVESLSSSKRLDLLTHLERVKQGEFDRSGGEGRGSARLSEQKEMGWGSEKWKEKFFFYSMNVNPRMPEKEGRLSLSTRG